VRHLQRRVCWRTVLSSEKSRLFLGYKKYGVCPVLYKLSVDIQEKTRGLVSAQIRIKYIMKIDRNAYPTFRDVLIFSTPCRVKMGE
jgi:hypothetical protein